MLDSFFACRYYQDSSDWSLKKLDVLVGVPERLSLGHLRGAGPQPGEQLQPAGEEPAAAGEQSVLFVLQSCRCCALQLAGEGPAVMCADCHPRPW